MNIIKTLVCLALFSGALLGALWPALREGKFNWLLDMDIQGGVQIVYRADFTSLPPEQQTAQEKQRLMSLSYQRLDARLANFQSADVRTQALGEDRLLVEVPGVRDIAKVKADLGKPKVISFARVASIAPSQDAEHPHLLKDLRLWLKTDAPVILGSNILYDQMKISAGQPDQAAKATDPGYRLSVPLDDEGQSKSAALTTQAFKNPAVLAGTNEKAVPMIALFLDQDLQDAFRVRSEAIRQGEITARTAADAEVLKRLLSSGPMPVKFDLYSERSISPLVGAALKDKGILAIIVSLGLLLILMILSYLDRPLFIFVFLITLLFWFLCLLTMANLSLFRISMLQLAGFILLLGMNSDTLVLVFEDLRQEFEQEERFKLALVGEAFKTEWWVVFWGTVTTLAVLLPLWFLGGIFGDYNKLMLLGLAVNILGFIFARILMSLPLAEDLSRTRLSRFSLASLFSRIDFNRFRYLPLGTALMIAAAVAIFYPGIPLSPAFAGGKAIEVEFPRVVSVAVVRQQLDSLAGKRAEIMTEGAGEMTKWVFARFPAGVELTEQEVLKELAAVTGIEPRLASVSAVGDELKGINILRVILALVLGLAALAVISVIIYNLKAGFYIILALLHDLLICLGCMALFRIQLDLPAVAALATMVGYSINDSIVILHRMRTLKIKKGAAQEEFISIREEEKWLQEIAAENIRKIPTRVILTAATTALPMFMMAYMASGVFLDYGIIILAGVIFGTLSSIYIVGRVVPWGFFNFGARQSD